MKKAGGGGGGGVATTGPVLRLRGTGWQQKYLNFRNFHFFIFSFCHNNDYVPEILETQSRSIWSGALLLIFRSTNL